MKYVLVSGGVMSGIGKGVIASSTGTLLKTMGLKVTAIKIDPYLNVDAGLMSPQEHGECFVLDDGGEADLDLGNYERFLNVTLSRDNNITTGKIYKWVIEEERKGERWMGKTVQVVPHVTGAIQDWIERVAQVPVDHTNEKPDVCIIELGGTVGDIESAPFIEAMRILRRRVGKGNFLQAHVTHVPSIGGEHKTKPTQAAIKDLRSTGLSPDIIAVRSSKDLEVASATKIADYCQVDPDQVIFVRDVDSTYRVPMLLETQGLTKSLRKVLQLDDITIAPTLKASGAAMWQEWKALVASQVQLVDEVRIVLVGKYTNFSDAYLSVIKSLEHASMHCKKKLKLVLVNAEDLEDSMQDREPAKYHNAWHNVHTAQGIIVPGGFGSRGTEGMIKAINRARKSKIPFLGICLGMQMAVIEFGRDVCGLTGAASEEFDDNAAQKLIVKMLEHHGGPMGATQRLGLRQTHFQPDSDWSKVKKLYGNRDVVEERHRHRYEVNPTHVEQLEKAGLLFVGRDTEGQRMEILELRDHPWFVGVQFHPEYLTRVLAPSPPYLGFVAAASGASVI